MAEIDVIGVMFFSLKSFKPMHFRLGYAQGVDFGIDALGKFVC